MTQRVRVQVIEAVTVFLAMAFVGFTVEVWARIMRSRDGRGEK